MDYLEIISEQDAKKIQELFSSQKPEFTITSEDSLTQYKVASHPIFDETVRPKKIITKDTGRTNDAGAAITSKVSIDVARVGLPFQKVIVERRVGFLLSEPVVTEVMYGEDDTSEQELVALIDRLQNDNKMDYKNKEIARRMMSELQCAELWYFVENANPAIKGKFTLRVKILSPDLGDELFPLFDASGDMVAFARGYKVKEEDKEIDHFDVYTSEFEYKYALRDGNLDLDPLIEGPNPIPNQIEKIPIIYHTQPEPEWHDVESMIERLETIVSNHADTNDYFGSPILAVSGEVLGYASKGESGKIIQLANGAQANYLALSSEPQSIKMEKDNLQEYIYAMSQTPDITFEQMKQIGPVSGVALRLMFLDAHMAVKSKEEIFGIGLQRRLNLIKAAIGKVVDTSKAKAAEIVQVKPIITPYIPENVTEMIDNLITAKSTGIISTESAVEQNPLVVDTEIEMERIDKDEAASLVGEVGPEQIVPGKKKEKS